MPEQEKTVPKLRCPMCGHGVFQGRECVRCHHWLPEPTEPGKHGKGVKCPICASYTLVDNLCGTCGARFVGDVVNRRVSRRQLLRREKEREEIERRNEAFKDK